MAALRLEAPQMFIRVGAMGDRSSKKRSSMCGGFVLPPWYTMCVLIT